MTSPLTPSGVGGISSVEPEIVYKPYKALKPLQATLTYPDSLRAFLWASTGL